MFVVFTFGDTMLGENISQCYTILHTFKPANLLSLLSSLLTSSCSRNSNKIVFLRVTIPFPCACSAFHSHRLFLSSTLLISCLNLRLRQWYAGILPPQPSPLPPTPLCQRCITSEHLPTLGIPQGAGENECK